ncbi:MAG: lipid-A-disaccharide synthase [Alphaproteobacteria bacterium]|jgi:lipid-A-disaccharide synthase|nr:lipid-A-disaccharide synthase [Alphaproteobacteria bacterium]
MTKKVYIIAGEPSGDFIGSKLISQLRLQNKDITFKFVGGSLMEKELEDTNTKSLFPISQIAIMGFIEVIAKIFSLKKLIKTTIKDIEDFNPDMVITIDSLGFNGRVVKSLKKQRDDNLKFQNTKFVHYVAPSVWAWKPKRAEKLAKLYDYLLCLFDFEIPYFEKHGLKTYAVGHPIVESGADLGNKENLIKKYNLNPNKRYILLMPGSRMSEVSRLLPTFLETAINLKNKYEDMEFIIPTLTNLIPYIQKHNQDLNALIITETQDKYDSFKLASMCIVASGTATLELSLANLPCIVAYRVNYLTSKLAGLLIKIKYASIINIISQEEIIKEFIQEKCTADNLTKASIKTLNDLKTNDNHAKVLSILKNLGYNEFIPSKKAAEIIISILN